MSIIKHVTLQKIVAHDFRYDPRTYQGSFFLDPDIRNIILKSIWNLLRVIKGVQLLGFQSKGYKNPSKAYVHPDGQVLNQLSILNTGPEYRVIRNDCRGFNNLSYTIHLR